MESSWCKLQAAVDTKDSKAVADLFWSELNIEQDEILHVMQALGSSEDLDNDCMPGEGDDCCVPVSCNNIITSTSSEVSKDAEGVAPASQRDESVASTCCSPTRLSATGPHIHASCASDSNFDLEEQEKDDVSTSSDAQPSEVSDIEDDPNRFVGYFMHPTFGDARILVELHRCTATEGSWTVDGETMKLAIREDGDFVLMSEVDGPTQLEGTMDPDTGLYCGVVIQDGERGGRFEVRPVCDFGCSYSSEETFLMEMVNSNRSYRKKSVEMCGSQGYEAAFKKSSSWKGDFKRPPSPQAKMTECKYVTVVVADADRNETNEVLAKLPKRGMKTFGDVRAALEEQIGADQAAKVKFLMPRSASTMKVLIQCDTDLLRTRKVLATGVSQFPCR